MCFKRSTEETKVKAEHNLKKSVWEQSTKYNTWRVYVCSTYQHVQLSTEAADLFRAVIEDLSWLSDKSLSLYTQWESYESKVVWHVYCFTSEQELSDLSDLNYHFLSQQD